MGRILLARPSRLCRGIAQENRGRAPLARVGFLLILGIDERAFWVRGWPGRLSR